MSLSIVIPTYNRNAAVLRLLKELEPLMESCEIVIVDDSTDETSESIRRNYDSKVMVLKNSERKGALASANMGFLAANNDIILTIGDDHHIMGNPVVFAERLVYHIRKHSSLVGLHVVDERSPPFNHKILGKLAWLIAGQIFPPSGDESGYADFASVFAFDKRRVPILYDVDFPDGGFNAESDFQFRARKIGIRLYYAADLKVFHEEFGHRKKSSLLRNHAYFLRKHFKYSWRVKQLVYWFYLSAVRPLVTDRGKIAPLNEAEPVSFASNYK